MSESPETRVTNPKKKKWKIILASTVLVAIIFVTFFALIVSSPKVIVGKLLFAETRDVEKTFDAFTQRFSAKITLAIANWGVTSVNIRDLLVQVRLNNINFGLHLLPTSSHTIRAHHSYVIMETFTATGQNAITLESAIQINVYVIIEGEVESFSCTNRFKTIDDTFIYANY